MKNLELLIEFNQQLLEQLSDEINSLSKETNCIESSLFYSKSISAIGGNSVGAHIRHILDFYIALCQGQHSGMINYDNRVRNTPVEKKLDAGITQIKIVQKMLKSLDLSRNRKLKVISAIDLNIANILSDSSLERELQSLHSHTTHHMAIIAIVFKLNNISIDKDFGKAPSTVQFENRFLARMQHLNKDQIA